MSEFADLRRAWDASCTPLQLVTKHQLPYSMLSARKDMLGACAVCRCYFPLLSPAYQRLVAAHEARLDDSSKWQLVRTARTGVKRAVGARKFADSSRTTANRLIDILDNSVLPNKPPLFEILKYLSTTGYPGDVTESVVCTVLRDIVPNPFSEQAIRRRYISAPLNGAQPRRLFVDMLHHYGQPCYWLTSAVLGLAQAAYTERDYTLLPVLGDALQEAGCDDQDVLAHCYHQQPHGHGCWVLELLLHYFES